MNDIDTIDPNEQIERETPGGLAELLQLRFFVKQLAIFEPGFDLPTL